MKHEGKWVWSDGTKWTFSNWARNEPNNHQGQNGQDCGGPWHRGKDWDDQACDTAKKFICKRKEGATAVPEPPAPKFEYKFVTSKKSWNDARGVCIQWGGDLASANNQAEMKVIQKVSKNSRDSFWIGANDKKHESKFTWSDGTAYKYSNWSRGEPNNWRGEDCAEVWRGGFEWNDLNCGAQRKFMCKRAEGAKPVPEPAAPKAEYKLNKNRMSWDDARATCKQWGGDLASIINMSEMKVVHKMLKGENDLVWIGASDKHKEKTWTWSDGEKWTFANWDNGEPNNSGGD